MPRAALAICENRIILQLKFLCIAIVMDEFVQCSSCSRLPQPREVFLDARGRQCKMCHKCREKARRRNSRPDVKEYTKNWLESQDQEELRKQRLGAAKEWIKREKQKDEKAYNARIQAVRKKSGTVKVRNMKKNAATRELQWNISDSDALTMITSPCVYCGYMDLMKTVNGIDRLDSSKHYMLENCVSCCSHCNFMKGQYDPLTFIERCRNIATCSYTFPEIPKYDEIKPKRRRQ